MSRCLSRIKTVVFGVLSIFLTILFVLVLFEIYLRFMNYPGKIYDINEKGLLIMRPNIEFILRKSCLKAMVKTNSQGFNSPYDYEEKKVEKELRIVVLGDSFVEGMQVNQGERFYEVLAEKLKEKFPNLKVTVYNFGRSGNGRLMNYLYYKNLAKNYNPDLVIDLFISNDVSDDNCAYREESFYATLRPCVILREDERLDMNEIEKQLQEIKSIKYSTNYRLKLLLKDMRSVNFIYQKLKEIKDLRKQRILIEKGIIPKEYLIFLKDYNDTIIKAWYNEEAVIKVLKEEVTKNGGIYLLVSGTDGFRVHPEIARELPEKWRSSFDFDKPEKVLKEITERNSVKYLPLVYEFRRKAKAMTVFPCDGHWNVYGHKLAGEVIYEYLLNDKEILRIIEDKIKTGGGKDA